MRQWNTIWGQGIEFVHTGPERWLVFRLLSACVR